MNLAALRAPACALARAAGAAILAVYRQPFAVEYKDDQSPLTQADLAAHRLLVAGLGALSPALPVLSEESAGQHPAAQRRAWTRYWLVDPLDGTREFVKRNDEFTVNIALVDSGVAVLGAVFAPALDELAVGIAGVGAWLEHGGNTVRLSGRQAAAVPVVAVSRSHADPATAALLGRLGPHQTLAAGSALKFIRLAQGAADLYPRLGPTSEWDTAAGQCVLEASGGRLTDFDGVPFRYNQRDSLLNPGFVAAADGGFDWLGRLRPGLSA
jgi:3'(2'), 5'-bisphosphate nucleotidase